MQRKQLSLDLFIEIAKLHNLSSSVTAVYVKSKENHADYFSRTDFKSFVSKNKCEITSVKLNDLLDANIGESIYMRIAVINHRALDIHERGL